MNSKLFSLERRKKLSAGSTKADPDEVRLEAERDYDRILFCTPVRRMADKTQVFPLEKNDSVRTRLTHSLEVSCLARSMGYAALNNPKLSSGLERIIPPILAAVGLAHDLGNPPFGHMGEFSIQSWFQKNKEKVLDNNGLTDAQIKDFLRFEGNAQTFRLVTKLQILNDNFGLDLTMATLSALVKYPVASDQVSTKKIHKKHGYFQSEKVIIDEVWDHLNLQNGQRHPLTYLMEACDDIAYLVLDAEDTIKKGLSSFNDLISFIKVNGDSNDSVTQEVLKNAEEKYAEYSKSSLSPKELNDISMQRFRVFAISKLVRSIQATFQSNFDKILVNQFDTPLIEASDAFKFSEVLRKFDYINAYRSPQVLALESHGYNVINELMDMLWVGISERKDKSNVKSKRLSPFSNLAYSLISENYRRVYESSDNHMPTAYKDAQLLTDMISGMTDQYAVDLHATLKESYNGKFKS